MLIEILPSTTKVTNEVIDERVRQDAKWGEQNHPNFPKNPLPLISDDAARNLCEAAFAAGEGTWAHILLEEFCEAIDTKTEQDLREELIQVAAVAVSWIEAIDRKWANSNAS